MGVQQGDRVLWSTRHYYTAFRLEYKYYSRPTCLVGEHRRVGTQDSEGCAILQLCSVYQSLGRRLRGTLVGQEDGTVP